MKPAGKQRLDQLLVDRGLVDSRQKGQALILAGSVLVNKQKIDKPGHSVAVEAEIEILRDVMRRRRSALRELAK